jgi:hypothetical protein
MSRAVPFPQPKTGDFGFGDDDDTDQYDDDEHDDGYHAESNVGEYWEDEYEDVADMDWQGVGTEDDETSGDSMLQFVEDRNTQNLRVLKRLYVFELGIFGAIRPLYNELMKYWIGPPFCYVVAFTPQAEGDGNKVKLFSSHSEFRYAEQALVQLMLARLSSHGHQGEEEDDEFPPSHDRESQHKYDIKRAFIKDPNVEDYRVRGPYSTSDMFTPWRIMSPRNSPSCTSRTTSPRPTKSLHLFSSCSATPVDGPGPAPGPAPGPRPHSALVAGQTWALGEEFVEFVGNIDRRGPGPLGSGTRPWVQRNFDYPYRHFDYLHIKYQFPFLGPADYQDILFERTGRKRGFVRFQSNRFHFWIIRIRQDQNAKEQLIYDLQRLLD